MDKKESKELALKLLDDMPKSIRDFFNYSLHGYHSNDIINIAKLYAKGIPESELVNKLKEHEQFTRLKNFLK